MKQIGRSKYTAKNQTICFKRTPELVKTSWNIAGKKAAATPISEADWHCSCSFTVLFSPPALHCNDAFNKGENLILLPQKVLQNVPECGVLLFMHRKRKAPNHQDFTSSLVRTGVLFLLSSGEEEKRSVKGLPYPWNLKHLFNDGTENPPSFHSSCSYLPRTCPFATWAIIHSLNQETPSSIHPFAP